MNTAIPVISLDRFSRRTLAKIVRFQMFAMLAIAAATSASAAGKHPFQVEGAWFEGCSCKQACAAAFAEVDTGCVGFGAMQFSAGRYQGTELKGVKIATAFFSDGTVRVYLDVPDAKRHEAAAGFARAYAKDFGKIEAVKDARIEITTKAGRFNVKVDGGKIMNCSVEAVLGADGIPVAHAKVRDTLNPKFFQGRTIEGRYHDSARSFELKQSNAFLNPAMKGSGEL